MDIKNLLGRLGVTAETHKALYEKLEGENPSLTDADIDMIVKQSGEHWKPILKIDKSFTKDLQTDYFAAFQHKIVSEIASKMKGVGVVAEDMSNPAKLAAAVTKFLEENKSKAPQEIEDAVAAAKKQWEANYASDITKAVEQAKTEIETKWKTKLTENQRTIALKDFFSRQLSGKHKDGEKEIIRVPNADPNYLNFNAVFAEKGVKPAFDENNRISHLIGPDGNPIKNASGEGMMNPNDWAAQNLSGLYTVKPVDGGKPDPKIVKTTLTTDDDSPAAQSAKIAATRQKQFNDDE